MMSEIVKRFLAIAGITCSKPSMTVWFGGPAASWKISIDTFERFLTIVTSNRHIEYQIDAEDPEIASFDLGSFKLSYLSIIVPYDPKTGWGKPRVQTEIEEISPEYSTTDRIKERAFAFAERIKPILETLLALKGAVSPDDFSHHGSR